MLRVIVIALAAAAACACSSPKQQEADAGGPAGDAGERSCVTSSDCESGEHCDVVLGDCGSHSRGILLSGRCTRPACGSQCLGHPCSSHEDCAGDQSCGTGGSSPSCSSPCCQQWGRCAAIPTCDPDCQAIWPAHSTCFACVCPSCDAPLDAGVDVPDAATSADANGPAARDAGSHGGDGGRGSPCLTASDCEAGEHCDAVFDKCGTSNEAVLVSSRCTKPACGAACLGQPCAASEECAEGQQCAMGLPGGPNCTSLCCQNGGRCTMEPNCRDGCTALWPPHETCFVCVCPSCDPRDAG